MSKVDNDEDCLFLLRQGKSTALDYLVRIYFPVLCAYAKKILNNTADAEDVTEDVFVKLWERHAAFSCIDELKGFLYTSVRNGSLNVLRSHKRGEQRNTAFARIHLDNDDPSGFVYEETLAEIRKSIYKLPKKMRLIVILSYYKQMNNAQIAEHLRLSPQTVRNQKSKGLSLLRDLLLKKVLLIFL